MQKSVLKEIILEQEQEIRLVKEGIPRAALETALKYASLPHAVVISGIRRCGKSTLLGQIRNRLYKERAYSFNFEDERLVNFCAEDFNGLYEVFLELYGERKVFFFDEIQNVPQWESFVNRMQLRGFKFFLTGSNASMLSRELGTKLTGRNVNLELFPFSFSEFLTFKGFSWSMNDMSLTSRRAAVKKHFSAYFRNGGMPEFLQYQQSVLLKRVYEDILYRDIVARYGIKQVGPLRELGLYLLSNLGGTFSYNNLKKVLGLGSMNTIKSYADFFENSYLIFLTSKFSWSLKKQFANLKKVYCIDNGLADSIGFQFSMNRGKFLENLVYLELRRNLSEIYYYKTSNNLEVDFLIKSGRQDLRLIQVADNLDHEKTRQRELNALFKAMGELKLKTALILTEDTQDEFTQEGKTITAKPVYSWLLEGTR